MKSRNIRYSLLSIVLLASIFSCQNKKGHETQAEPPAGNFSVSQLKTGKQASKRADTSLMLINLELAEIKEYVNGVWELVKAKNAHEQGEFENTYITFDDDRYVWTEEGKSEPGALNWRKAATGMGFDAYLMDVFYAESPAFPIAIHEDTLFIQDGTETGYLYSLIRK